MVLARGPRRPRRPVGPTVRHAEGRVARLPLDALVRGRPRQHRRQHRRSPPGRHARADLGRRRRRPAGVDPRRAAARGESGGERTARPRHRRGRRRRPLHADGAGDGGRILRLPEDRRRRGPGVLRVRVEGARRAPAGRGGEDPVHRRRREPARQDRAAQAGSGRRRARVPDGAPRDRPEASRHRGADGRTGSLLGRRRGRRVAGGGDGVAGGGSDVDDPVHLRHHRPAEGHGGSSSGQASSAPPS
jgi:hypothetical protein